MSGTGPARMAFLGSFAPPDGLLSRVRWIFLLASLVMAALVVPTTVASDHPTPASLRAAAFAGLAFLAWRYARGYRRSGFSPLPLTALEGLALGAACLATGNPPSALGLVYAGLMFRSLYGRTRDAVSVLAAYLVAFYGAVALTPLATGGYAVAPASVLPNLFGLVLMSLTLHLLSLTLSRQGRALDRERTLRDAGAALAASHDRQMVYDAALAAALRLVGKGVPSVRSGLAMGSEEEMDVLASAGHRAEEIMGYKLAVRNLPEGQLARLLDGRSVGGEDASADVVLRSALGLTPRPRPFFMIPLLIEEELRGVIIVASDATLPGDIKQGLETLGFQVSLALEAHALTESAYRRRGEERLRTLVSNVLDVIMVVAPDGNLTYLSPSVERFLGHRPEDLLGTNGFDLVRPDDLETAQQFFGEVMQSGPEEHGLMEVRLTHRDGSWRYAEVTASNRTSDERVGGVIVTVRDITERKKAEEELSRLASFPRLNPNPVMEVDLSGNLTYCNPAGRETFPDLEEKGSEHPVLSDLDAAISRLALGEEAFVDDEVGVGEAYYHRVVSLVTGNALVRVYVIDITRRKALEDQLSHRAFHDALTGLPNRALFMNRLDHALERARRTDEEEPDGVAVLFVDLDRFKAVNDTLGHEAGDDLLVEVSGRLGGALRPGDTVARLAGDEFAVLLEDVSGSGEVVRAAERLLEVLEEPFRLGARETFVTASIGVALGGLDGRALGEKTAKDLLREADVAMYAAKKGGTRHAVYKEEMGTRALERLRLENDLRRAVEDPAGSGFRLHYQPKLGLATGEISGVEALARWDHPERGNVPPEVFVPLAEETGLIVPLGEWVLGEACRRAVEWQGLRPSRPPGISVNLSVRQLRQEDLVERVARVIEGSGLPPEVLSLEITEGLMLENEESILAKLQGLKALGLGLEIDDFGTGYSSLSYLKRLPVEVLKIDRSFVEDLTENPEARKVVRSIVDLARALNLSTVAEGIETRAQLETLKALGCELGQGYLFSRPVPAEEIPPLLTLGPDPSTPEPAS
ncbi:EAL domain-containing protein [Rubrobacter marinus]|uniref:EAL domain-containing protein n=1 Tax=Rubrobacter marinus TaxID=2653852 RepID=A0A6G8PVB9_9ACTN|nr:EAL domain-containing protein [Rubrobacter marinus]QIN78152.1 EAL domain-containing protein [Rubrobacter marinus]